MFFYTFHGSSGVFYPLIRRVLPSHPACFTLSSAFYPLIRVLPSHPCFTLSSVFYPFIRVLPSHPRFTLSSVFYSLIRVLPSHPCFTLSSVFYPLIRVLPSHPCFTLSSVRPSAVYTFIRSAFYPNAQKNLVQAEKIKVKVYIIYHKRWTLVRYVFVLSFALNYEFFQGR